MGFLSRWSLNKTLLNHTHVKCESETLKEKEKKERTLDNIKFEKNLIIKISLKKLNRIIQFYCENSLTTEVGCRRTLLRKINQIKD